MFDIAGCFRGIGLGNEEHCFSCSPSHTGESPNFPLPPAVPVSFTSFCFCRIISTTLLTACLWLYSFLLHSSTLASKRWHTCYSSLSYSRQRFEMGSCWNKASTNVPSVLDFAWGELLFGDDSTCSAWNLYTCYACALHVWKIRSKLLKWWPCHLFWI